jgi:hypothetical protein
MAANGAKRLLFRSKCGTHGCPDFGTVGGNLAETARAVKATFAPLARVELCRFARLDLLRYLARNFAAPTGKHNSSMSRAVMAWFNTKVRVATVTTVRSVSKSSALRVGFMVNSLLLGWGCSSANIDEPGSFGETPAAVQRSEQGQFEVALFSSPTDKPMRGDNHVRLEVLPENEDDVTVTPSLVTFMPAMGHGSGVTPKLTEIEEPLYTFEDVVLNMPGRWELRVRLEGEDQDGATHVDHAVFEFDVD